MAVHTIDKGLDLPLAGAPAQEIDPAPKRVTRVAVVADDFPGMKARMAVNEGDTVRRGQLLFENRKQPGVRHVAPGAGKVVAIHRGARRALLSVVIALSPSEIEGRVTDEEQERFASVSGRPASELDREAVVAALVESGLWTCLRQRPYGVTPPIDAVPTDLFVNAMCTEPLAADPDVALAGREEDFAAGLAALSTLPKGKTYLCVGAGSQIGADLKGLAPKVQREQFRGPHPAGLSGLHVHLLSPVHRQKTVFTVHYQDVAAVGALLRTGTLPVERVVALGGPSVARPRLVRTRLGANLEQLFEGELTDDAPRLISGSALSGKAALGEVFSYLGQHHLQATALPEGGERELLGWLRPGARVFSSIPIFLSRFLPRRPLAMNTDTHGSPRAMVPIGMYERVMPMDILPTHLLRAMLVGDLEMAEKLGALELDEEDLALCTFVDPGKTDFGPVLRRTLDALREEG